MIQLLRFLFDAISTAANPSTEYAVGVYLDRAPEDADFPYITFRLAYSYEQEAREDHMLDVEMWDNAITSTDPTVFDALERRVDGNGDRFAPTGLNGRKYYGNGIAARVYRLHRLMLPDPDEGIRRRRIRYRVSAYDSFLIDGGAVALNTKMALAATATT